MSSLPGAYIKDFVELVGRWKIAPDTLLAGLPIDFAKLSEPTTKVPLRVCEAILGRALELTHEPALAVHVGTQMRVSTHGFLGFAAMTASTAREALDLAVRFASTRTSAIGLALYVEGKTASLVIEERTPLTPLVREFVVIALFVGIWQLGQALTGAPIDGAAECAFTAPDYIGKLPTAGRVRFGCPANRLVFPSSVLDLPLRSADAVATRLAREQCERELAEVVDASLPGRIRVLLAESDGTRPLDDVAKQLRISPRTIKRKLAERGTTFSELRDDLRRQRALLLLDNRELSIGEVATRLGYSELPNFTRAFRKWTGKTPLAYRERAR
ncbi:MAG: AraC family transcriptional regulator [Myxococcota bacterium]|nr:AraC family transcriptional regulator [Myxococcota bacterium]